MSNAKHPMAWVWQLEDGSLCHWAEPSKDVLIMNSNKPSPGAIPKCVRLILNSEYLALRKSGAIQK